MVTFFDKSGINKKYKMKLENGDKSIRIKKNEKGEYL